MYRAPDQTIDLNTAVKDGFRMAMRRLAASVSVISAAENGVRYGMTASSVTSLSFEPLSLLVCVNKTAGMHDVLERADAFCINLLCAEQHDISDRFCRPADGEERFASGDWQWQRGLPWLKGAQANMFCRKGGQFEHGTHTIFVGDVLDVFCDEKVSPLAYLDGRYAQVSCLHA